MFAEIITIGDELLIGQVVDTNSAWMGTRTYQRRYHQTNFMQILSYRTGFQRRSIRKCKTGTGRENTNECTQQKPGNGSERLYSDK